MNKHLDNIIDLLKANMRLLLGISFGLFLFVLFFQPFPLQEFDFNNRLLIMAGLGLIIFLFLALIRVAFPLFIRRSGQNIQDILLHPYINGFILIASSSVALAFYLHYVALVEISFYVMFKIVLICSVSPVVLSIYDKLKEVEQQNLSLLIEKKTIQKQVDKYEDDYLNKSIEFVSENNIEKFKLLVADVALIKSADNYVEIVFKEGDQFKQKLIRSTLKNIEQQLMSFSIFIRCHRICIVNTHFIESLNKKYNNYWLAIKGFNEQIPVSRQYVLKLKETI